MHITFQETKSALYFSFWVVFVIGVPFLWSITYGYSIYHLATPLICGCVVGLISALSPARSFLVGFLGFFITGVLSSVGDMEYFAPFAFLGIFCGLIALTCAVIRRLVLRSKSEQLRLVTWQWAVLIGGVGILADCFLIPFHYNAVIQMHYFSSFLKSLAVFAIGLFATGLYTGAYYDHEHKTSIRDTIKFSVSGHFVFLICFIFLLLMKLVFRGDILFLPVVGLLFLFLLLGTKLGFKLGKNSHGVQLEI